MKLPIILLVLSFSLSYTAQAQINYVPGFIISNEGDTTHGKIQHKSAKKIAKAIKFRKNDSSLADTYLPDEIKGFYYEDFGYFVSRKVMLDSLHTRFLELLIEGDISLYLTRDKKGKHYFAGRDSLIELKNDKETVAKNGLNYAWKKEQFRYTLSQQMKDSEQVQKEIKEILFRYHELIELTENYHKSLNKEYKNLSRDISIRSSIGIEIEQLHPSLTDDIIVYAGLSGEDFEVKSPERSVILMYSLSKLFAAKWNIDFHVGAGYSDMNISSTRYDIQQQSLIVPLYGTYRLWTNKFSPVLRVGLKNYFSFQTAVQDKRFDRPSTLDNLVGRYHIGAQAGAGFQFKQKQHTFYLFGLYERRINMLRGTRALVSQTVSSPITGLSLNLGYRIGIN